MRSPTSIKMQDDDIDNLDFSFPFQDTAPWVCVQEIHFPFVVCSFDYKTRTTLLFNQKFRLKKYSCEDWLLCCLGSLQWLMRNSEISQISHSRVSQRKRSRLLLQLHLQKRLKNQRNSVDSYTCKSYKIFCKEFFQIPMRMRGSLGKRVSFS